MAGVGTIVVTGARGQLGVELVAALAPHGEVRALDHAALDVGDPDAVRAALVAHAPRLIVNAAAYTEVDRAEQEHARAFAVNAAAPGVLAEYARAHDAVLVHYSTDYVFDGLAATPYDEDAATGPLNVYGASKLAGEAAVRASGAHALVLRTSWVYGLRGRNFLMTIRRLAATHETLRIVADQHGTPNWTRALAGATARLIAPGLAHVAARSGLYHMSARGEATWYEFARAILGDAGASRVVPITTAEYPTPARRPARAVLATARFEQVFGFALPDWRQSLHACLTECAEPLAPDGVARPPIPHAGR